MNTKLSVIAVESMPEAKMAMNLMSEVPLADYSEFVFDRNILSYLASDRQIKITTVESYLRADS